MSGARKTPTPASVVFCWNQFGGINSEQSSVMNNHGSQVSMYIYNVSNLKVITTYINVSNHKVITTYINVPTHNVIAIYINISNFYFNFKSQT